MRPVTDVQRRKHPELQNNNHFRSDRAGRQKNSIHTSLAVNRRFNYSETKT